MRREGWRGEMGTVEEGREGWRDEEGGEVRREIREGRTILKKMREDKQSSIQVFCVYFIMR